MKTLELIFMLLSGLAMAAGPEPIHLSDTYGVDDGIYHWKRVPVLFGRAEVSRIDSQRPIVPCERVLEASHTASEQLKLIFQEQQALATLLEKLKDASPGEIEVLLTQVRALAARIEEHHRRLQVLYPPELQEKDRVRTLYWAINPLDFADLGVFPQVPKIEWAQLEVLSGEGGWFGKFIPKRAEERPLRVRFESFLTRFDRDPALKVAIRNEFSGLLRSIRDRFAASTPGARGQLDWQGTGEITLMQELSPVEACVPYLHLTSSLLLDFDVRGPGEYPSPEFTSDEKVFRLGMGPVILTYYDLRRH